MHIVMLWIPLLLLLLPVVLRRGIALGAYGISIGLVFSILWGLHFYETSQPDFNDSAGGGFGVLIFLYWTMAFVAGFALRLLVDALIIIANGIVESLRGEPADITSELDQGELGDPRSTGMSK